MSVVGESELAEDGQYGSPPPQNLHRKLFSLRDLTAQGIPCTRLGTCTLTFGYDIPVSARSQTILVPDDALDEAAIVLLKKGHTYLEHLGTR